MLARIVQPEGNLTGESLREAAYPLATARGSSFPAWRQLLFLGLPFLQLSGHQGWATEAAPLLGAGVTAVPPGEAAEARSDWLAAAVGMHRGLKAAAGAAVDTPPLLGAGEAAVLSGGSAEARARLRAAAVEVRNMLGDASAAADESPPLLGAGFKASDVVLQTADPTRGFTDASSWTSSSHVSQRTPDARRMAHFRASERVRDRRSLRSRPCAAGNDPGL